MADKIAVPSVTPIFMNVQRMLPAERRHYYNSLHAKKDEMVPQSMIPRVLESPSHSLPIPRKPRSEPKISLPRAALAAMAAQDSDSDEGSDDNDADDNDSDDNAHVRQMPMGRSVALRKPAPTAPSEDDDLDKSMPLMGLGRGRPICRK